VNCRWKRRIGTHLIEIPGINGTQYHLSADDIGMSIVCLAEPLPSSGVAGTACGDVGPIELDPITRLGLEDLVSRGGGSRFPVRHFRDPDDPHPRDTQIHDTQDFVKVVHPGPERGNHEESVTFSADHPKIVLHPTATQKFRLELGDGRDRVYHFAAYSRTARDTIALLVRCFHSRRYVATSFILSKLYQNPATPGAPLTTMSCDNFDVHKLVDRLTKELDRTVGKLDAVSQVVRQTKKEKQELEDQLGETISSYTHEIEKLHQQIAKNKGGPAAELPLQLAQVKQTIDMKRVEMEKLRKELDEEHARQSTGFGKEAESLRNEIAYLQSSIQALTVDGPANTQRDSNRAEELRRLRQDVQQLQGEKEMLEESLRQADREKHELIDNFLYVKGCLDKVQDASLMIQPVSPEMERELAQARTSYSQAVDERNRMAVRVESLDREQEKQKTQCEASLERVMAANGRLMEERDRLQKETARISDLYQRTMTAMGAVSEPAGHGNTAGALSPGELEALRQALQQKTDLLKKRSEENEGLRTRLRKLAMV
jgi:hypothetical protein